MHIIGTIDKLPFLVLVARTHAGGYYFKFNGSGMTYAPITAVAFAILSVVYMQ